jgi:hypothetical protein
MTTTVTDDGRGRSNFVVLSRPDLEKDFILSYDRTTGSGLPAFQLDVVHQSKRGIEPPLPRAADQVADLILGGAG